MKSLLLALVLIALLAAATGTPYNGLNKGIVWAPIGGVEYVGQPGIFLCQASPFAPLFSSIVADC